VRRRLRQTNHFLTSVSPSPISQLVSTYRKKSTILRGAFIASLLLLTTSAHAAFVNVDSSQTFNSTGIQVIAGQVYFVTATGSVNLATGDGPYITDPDGTILVAPNSSAGSYFFFTSMTSPGGTPPAVGDRKYPLLYPGQSATAALGALVAGLSAIANPTGLSDFPSGFELIGSSGFFIAPSGGYLFFAVNDNAPGDNLGTYSAEITLTPEPGTLSLTVSAFAAWLCVRRRYLS